MRIRKALIMSLYLVSMILLVGSVGSIFLGNGTLSALLAIGAIVSSFTSLVQNKILRNRAN